MPMSFAASDLFETLTLLVGGILLLKKVAEMNRYHELRVFVLATFLSCIVIYFFLMYGFTFGNPIQNDVSDDVFTLSEV